jgi:hypothetical protein
MNKGRNQREFSLENALRRDTERQPERDLGERTMHNVT